MTLKTLEELAKEATERADHYAMGMNREANKGWQEIADALRLIVRNLKADAPEMTDMTVSANMDVGRAMYPLEGYTFHMWQGQCSKLWGWYIRSKEYGQVFMATDPKWVEKEDAEQNLALVAMAFAEEREHAKK